jgi:SAM-dependent methyltransferase
MKKAYEGHEAVYREMKRRGVCSWDEHLPGQGGHKRPAIDQDDQRFLVDVLAQPWAPSSGRAIELGCGTAPMLRWLCAKGFSGVGVDVSRTAIAMARAQSRGLGIRFKHADLCHGLPVKPATFDLALDGHCLHCIISATDRKAFLRNVRRLLKPGGLFLVLTMAAPVDRRALAKCCPNQILRQRTLYVPLRHAGDVVGARRINGQLYMPTRCIRHWKHILTELRRAGFRPQLLRYNGSTANEPTGSLAAALAGQ